MLEIRKGKPCSHHVSTFAVFLLKCRQYMKKICELKNYREKYKRYYGIEFGTEYVVHHIDENRGNNSIDNLLLLPKELHSKYHTYKCMYLLSLSQAVDTSLCLDLSYTGSRIRDWQLDDLDRLRAVLKECRVWIEKKYLADNGYGGYSDFERRIQ